MGKVKSVGWLSLVVIFLAVVFYFLARSLSVLDSGYSWGEMDWNGDGSTSISEFFYSSDVGVRSAEHNGERCKEFYSYKDGLPVKTICKSGDAVGPDGR